MRQRDSAIFLGLLLTACGVAGTQAVRPAGSTFSSSSPAVAPSRSTVADSAAQADFDLTSFKPLLAEPMYAEVRAWVDQAKWHEAALALHQKLTASGSSPGDGTPGGIARLRAQYLLGTLWLDAENESAALDAFVQAAAHDWVLREDSLLRVAQLQIRSGKPDLALASLAGLEALSDTPGAARIRAEALSSVKNYEASTSAFRTLLAIDESPEVRLSLAHTLLLWAEACEPGEQRKRLAEEAAYEAQLAGLGYGPDEEIVRQIGAIVSQCKASGANTPRDFSMQQRLRHLRGLVEEKELEEAEEVAAGLSFPKTEGFSSGRCEYDYLLGKILSGQRRWGEAADRITSAAQKCSSDPQRHAWLLFNAGKYNAADGRHTKAVKFYEELERLYPSDSLADDARLRAARSYESMGVASRFISLLSSMPEDYPDGDMTMEGVLTLALHRIERGDWAGAAQVLERGAQAARDHDSARGHEYSGTERYFLARAQQELGQKDAALAEYESIIVEVPLSYYMLHAYSRLLEADPKRAQKALTKGLARAKVSPFNFPYRSEYESAEFLRGMELLRVGDMERGRALLAEVGLAEDADDSLLWGIALLYDRAGDAHTSHSIARGRLTDWFAHYPEGDWQGAWEIGFPRPYYPIVERESKATGVPEWFIYGVMREESTFKPRVVSAADAYGLMQVIEPTARGIARKSGHPTSPEALKTPAVNIAIGARVLKELSRRFQKNPWLAIPGYNAGPGNPSKWLRERPNVDFDVWVEMIPYRETRRYTKRVLASRAAYAFLYYRQEAQTALILPRRLSMP